MSFHDEGSGLPSYRASLARTHRCCALSLLVPAKGGIMQIVLMPWPCPEQAKQALCAILHTTEGSCTVLASLPRWLPRVISAGCFGSCHAINLLIWWAVMRSNRWSSRCKRYASPTELTAPNLRGERGSHTGFRASMRLRPRGITPNERARASSFTD